MDTPDALTLARVQFALNIGVHILFPSITIGLAWLLLWLRIRAWRTGEARWLAAYRLWTKIFALSFAMGVVTGIAMAFQFGTNWPHFMTRVGNIASPLLAYEVLTAFFLEATFLGVMLFAMDRVPSWAHIAATALVAFGTTLSAFWILALNSWMQTPAGHAQNAGALVAADWGAVIFNPSFPYRLVHMTMASALTTSFLVAGLSAWRLLRAPGDAAANLTLRVGIWCAAVLSPLQILAGDLHGLNTLEHQPAKIAAVEALWQTRSGAPLVLFALPDADERSNRFSLEIPKGSSLILRHAPDAEVQGLDAFGADIPPVALVFFAFRVMVGIGLAMLLLSWIGAVKLRRPGPPPRRLLWTFAAFSFAGWPAVLAGWTVTESGRQPWLVTGILRTSQAAGDAAPAVVGTSLAGYAAAYAVMLLAYMVILTHLAAAGSSAEAPDLVPGQKA